MQKTDGNLKLDTLSNQPLPEERGFTERSLNLLLSKIIDDECKQEALDQGFRVPDLEGLEGRSLLEDAESWQPPAPVLPKKRLAPLIKSMYVRDPHRVLFKIQKFDPVKMAEDEDYCLDALDGIKYDHRLECRKEFTEYLDIIH